MSTVRASLVASADAGALTSLWPHVSVIGRLAHPHTWVAQVGADHAAAELCLAAMWLVAAWLGAGIIAGVAAELPGAAGRLGVTVAHVVLPRALYRIVAGAAGLGVLVSPGLATAAPAPPPVPTAATAMPTPDWPTDSAIPTPKWPTDPPRHHDPRPAVRQYRTQPRPTQHRDATRTVVVQPGDSLWRIAAEHLPGHPTPKRIARAWPRWYAANRAVIGDDPNLIVPGQHLHTPPERPAP